MPHGPQMPRRKGGKALSCQMPFGAVLPAGLHSRHIPAARNGNEGALARPAHGVGIQVRHLSEIFCRSPHLAPNATIEAAHSFVAKLQGRLRRNKI